MPILKAELHPAQLDIFKSPARFKVVAAGRRFGKTRLAIWLLLVNALQSQEKDVAYVAPTFEMAKKILWDDIKRIGKDIITNVHENTAVITLVNGRKIHLKGADRPDTLRGVGYAFVVLDEYASMKPAVWELALRPTLADVKGSALFIGTPDGKNHFYDLYLMGGTAENWESWTFSSRDNPFIDPAEIEAARQSMSTQAFRQEFEASFESFGAGMFKEEWIKILKPDHKELKILQASCTNYLGVDLAGFEEVNKEAKNKKKNLDEHALAIVGVHQAGWHIWEIEHGRWNTREASIRMLRLAQKYQATRIGIEKGSLKNAVMPYLEDQMRRIGFYPHIDPNVTHGNKDKTERIAWALQGRFEHGRITLAEGNWNKHFISQLLDFPNPLVHDDLPDAVSVIDQIAVTDYAQDLYIPEFEPLDIEAGY